MLRGIINIREPKDLKKEIIDKESKLLQLELKEKKIIDIILHDGNMNKIDYEFNEYELVRIYNWIDALNSIALKKLDIVRSKLKNIDLKLSIMALAKEKGNVKIYNNYFEEIKRELGSIFKDDVLNDIMQDLIDNL